MRTPALTLALTMIAGTAIADISWRENLREAHAQAQVENKPLLLHFYTDNCPWCDKLEEGAFQVNQVCDAVNQQFVPVKVHAGRNPKLTKMFEVTKFPSDVVVTTEGTTLSHTVSPQDPKRFIAMLAAAMPQPGVPAGGGNVADAAPNGPAAITANDFVAKAEPPQATSHPAGEISTSIAMPFATAAKTVEAAPAAPAGGFRMPGEATGQFAASRANAAEIAMPPMPAPTGPTAEPAADPTGPANPLNPTAELAIQGFCAVSVVDGDEWVEGSPDFGVVHLGKLYLFASKEKLQTFLADPVPYTPVLNEMDVVRFFEERRIVPGKREWGLKDPTYNRMFFFADEASMLHFWNEYERYTDAAIEVMDKAVREANPGA